MQETIIINIMILKSIQVKIYDLCKITNKQGHMGFFQAFSCRGKQIHTSFILNCLLCLLYITCIIKQTKEKKTRRKKQSCIDRLCQVQLQTSATTKKLLPFHQEAVSTLGKTTQVFGHYFQILLEDSVIPDTRLQT